MALTLSKLLSISLDIATEMLSNQLTSTRLFVVGLPPEAGGSKMRGES